MRRVIVGLLLCLSPIPAGASSSWQVRTYPEGSGVWVTRTDSNSLRVFGTFTGGPLWDTYNAGLSGNLLGSTFAFPVDSIASVADEGELIVSRGRMWVRDYPEWRPLAMADSVGTITAAAGNFRHSDILTFANAAGSVYQWDGHEDSLSRIVGFEGTTVRRFFGMGEQSVRLLLADGRIIVQEGGWTASPMRASVAGFWDDERGYAIEEGTLRFWSTTDGGLQWTVAGDTLASPSLAGWAARARNIAIDASGRGVIACGDAVLLTRDGGAGWAVAAVGAGMFLDAALDTQGQILTVGSRLHRCASGAFDFEQVGGGDFARTVMGSAATLWAQDGGVLLSVDQGRRWFRNALPDAPGRLRRIAARGDYDLWLHFDGEDGSRAFRTRDRGNTFIALDPAGLLRGAIAWTVIDSLSAWAATRDAVLRSVDGGLTWSVVRERLDGIQALAATDSLHAAARTSTAFLYTTDGGASWLDGPAPPAEPFTAVDLTPDGGWVASGGGVFRASPGDPWSMTASVAAGDTLRDISIAADGSGWAAGTSGLLLGSGDAGRTWEPYRLNLELNAIDTTFVQLDFLDAGAGVTGVGRKLLRFLPDHSGPIFRIGVSANPFLPRHVDIHVTARERLRGDSLRVRVDDVEVPSTLLDPEGYLYRARFEIPAMPGERLLTVSGRDWQGNERSDARPLLGLQLDVGGRARARWSGVPILLDGEAAATVILLGMEGEIETVAPANPMVGTPFAATTTAPTTIDALEDGVDLLCWDGEHWLPADGRPVVPGERSTWVLVRAEGGSADADPLRIYPLPSRGACTIEWSGPAAATMRWELFDLAGRRIASGVLPAGGGRAFRWRGVDADGRALSSGVYWLRASVGREVSTRKILIER
jgi:photosystem II stability/assembly factor-like uncharacterized protein